MCALVLLFWFVITPAHGYCFSYACLAGLEEATPKNPDPVSDFLRGIIWQLWSVIKYIIWYKTAETIITMALISLVYVIYTKIIKGRHRYNQSTKTTSTSTPPISSSTNVSVVNTLLNPEWKPNNSSPVRNSSSNPRDLLNKPETFREGMNIDGWIAKMENYLKEESKRLWAQTIISYLDEACIERIQGIQVYTGGSDGYEMLKKNLQDKFNKKITQAQEENKVRLVRYQEINEAVDEYGKVVKEKIAQMFPKSKIEALDECMQENFAGGLIVQKLREKVKKKMHTMSSKSDETFDINNLIQYATLTFKSFDSDEELKTIYANIAMVMENNNKSSGETSQAKETKQNQNQNQTSQNNQQPYYNRNRNYRGGYNNNYNRNYDRNYIGNRKPAHENQNKPDQNKNDQQQHEQCFVGQRYPKQNSNSAIKGKAIFNNTLVEYLCDGGADLSIINVKLYHEILRQAPKTTIKPYQGKPLASCTGEIKVKGVIVLDRCILVPKVSKWLEKVEIIVTEHTSSNQCLIGRDIINRVPELRKKMEAMKSLIDEWSQEIINYYQEINLVVSESKQDEQVININSNEVVIFKNHDKPTQESPPEPDVELVKYSEEQLSEAREKLNEKLITVSARKLTDLEPQRNHAIEFKIELVNPNQPPIRCKSRPLPWSLKEKVKTALEEQEAAGIIRKSKSQWSSALRVVPKPDGTVRLTVDFKPLNRVIKGDSYPLPSVEDLYNKLVEAGVISTIDLKAAYHQVPMAACSIQFTAFVCEFGLFEYLSMPMGIKNAPSWFQRAIEGALQEFMNEKVVSVYLDDAILYTKTLDEHVQWGLQVMDALHKNGFKLSLEKSKLVRQEMPFLGNIISFKQIKPNPERARCLFEKAKPKTIRDVQVWLGIVNYYRRFIKQYAELARPLYGLTGYKYIPVNWRRKNGTVDGKKVIVEWNEEADESFRKIKEVLCSDLILALPNFNKPFSIETDASDYGYGAVLQQETDGIKRPVAFFSKNYTQAQRKYPTSEKELLALIMSVEYFHQYLYGRPFVAYTDHMPLTWLLTKKEPHPRLERWMMRISIYQITIVYIPGKENVIADLLSRLPDEDEVAPEEDDYHDIVIASVEQEDGVEASYFEIDDAVEQQVPSKQDEKINIDVISMIPTSEPADEYTSFKEEQEKDADLEWIKAMIKTHGENKPSMDKFKNKVRRVLHHQYENLCLVEDILYHEAEDVNGYRYTQYVLPAHIVNKVINNVHSSIFCGHLGRKKTVEKIKARFYRPFLNQEVKLFIKTCDRCQRVKNTQPKRRAELQYLRASRPNQLVTLDLAGPYPKTERGNTNLMVIVDHFTKLSEYYALPDTKQTTIAEVIVNEWSCRYGVPEMILSDRGTQLNSKQMELIYDALDILKLKTTAYHPECDGESERAIQTMKSMIKAYIDEDQSNWDLNLSKLAFAYNSAVHATTQQTPFEMMFLRKPRIPIDLVFPQEDVLTREKFNKTHDVKQDQGEVTIMEDVDVQPDVKEDAIKYLNEMNSKIRDCFKVVESNRDLVMDKAKWNHDRKIRKHEYRVGDLVLVNHPQIKAGLSQGLAIKYRGPFKVMGVNANKCDYLIKEINKPKAKMKQVHKNRLKSYFEMGKPFAHSEECKHKAVQTIIKMTQLDENKTSAAKNKTIKNKIAKRLIKKASKSQVKIQNKKANPSNARTEQASQENKPAKRKYTKNPNNPRWKMKETRSRLQASKTSEDPKSLRRSPRLAKK